MTAFEKLAYRVETLECYLGLEPDAPADPDWPCTLQELIADEMTTVTLHSESRIDAVVKQADLLQSLLISVKALVLDLGGQIAALESKTPC